MSPIKSASSNVKITGFRFDILQLCASEDEQGHQGIPFYRRLKPASKRAVRYLMVRNLVYYDAFGALVTTPGGYDLYRTIVDACE